MKMLGESWNSAQLSVSSGRSTWNANSYLNPVLAGVEVMFTVAHIISVRDRILGDPYLLGRFIVLVGCAQLYIADIPCA
jgi:hypothetical protein